MTFFLTQSLTLSIHLLQRKVDVVVVVVVVIGGVVGVVVSGSGGILATDRYRQIET